jgi:hypothetical protein
MKAESEENEMSVLKIDVRCTGLTPSCGAVDRRECTMMKHIILAEIRRSNAPAWVAEEVDKKLNCHDCESLLPRRIPDQSDNLSAVASPGNRGPILLSS